MSLVSAVGKVRLSCLTCLINHRGVNLVHIRNYGCGHSHEIDNNNFFFFLYIKQLPTAVEKRRKRKRAQVSMSGCGKDFLERLKNYILRVV